MSEVGPSLVVHGHFYQPPRENPWTGEVPEEEGAAPFHDWNERITDECYGPVGRVDLRLEDGVAETVNLFDHLSFNVGPTLMSWLEGHHPEVHERIVDADRRCRRAIAQAYGHAILPLCNDHDVWTHVRWGMADFEHRFGRRPEGMWLPETAVSERVLGVLAEAGLRFTILAPGQLEAVRSLDPGDGAWQPVEGGLEGTGTGSPTPVPIDRPYRWIHPTRPELHLDLVFYDGHLAHALAFGDPTAEEMVAAVVDHDHGLHGMLTAATDGETFGHHRNGAERQLARALVVEAPRRGVRTPRLVDLLDARPAVAEARVRVSAWSCVHGVGRWTTDCGCSAGGQQGWVQAWREPLRNALDLYRDWASEVFERRGEELLDDPWEARDRYIDVLLGRRAWEDFAADHVVGDPDLARSLLEAQRHALLMYTSCGWFFNDLAGLETVQILRYAARSMDHHRDLAEVPPVEGFLDELARARSNDLAAGDGRQVWHERVDGGRPGWAADAALTDH